MEKDKRGMWSGTVCGIATNSVLQRLKPPSFCGVYVVAEATTYKDS
jgi:hypothetical protein